MATRIYQQKTLKINEHMELDERATHHLARVLRAKIGDKLIIFNGGGGEFFAEIIAIDKKKVTVNIINFSEKERESPLNLTLAQGITRGEKMDFIIQKAVELGVNKIVPLITERTNVRLNAAQEEKRMQHWQAIMISACEQCSRNRLPEIIAPLTLPDFFAQMTFDYGFVLSPHVKEKLPTLNLLANSTVSLLIGPEGGFSDNEMHLASQHHFLPLNLGPRILRAETATIAALSVLQNQYGDF